VKSDLHVNAFIVPRRDFLAKSFAPLLGFGDFNFGEQNLLMLMLFMTFN
jgi:hypothetical protein